MACEPCKTILFTLEIFYNPLIEPWIVDKVSHYAEMQSLFAVAGVNSSNVIKHKYFALHYHVLEC